MSKSSRDAMASGVKPWLTASSYATEEALLPGICACTLSLSEVSRALERVSRAYMPKIIGSQVFWREATGDSFAKPALHLSRLYGQISFQFQTSTGSQGVVSTCCAGGGCPADALLALAIGGVGPKRSRMSLSIAGLAAASSWRAGVEKPDKRSPKTSSDMPP